MASVRKLSVAAGPTDPAYQQYLRQYLEPSAVIPRTSDLDPAVAVALAGEQLPQQSARQLKEVARYTRQKASRASARGSMPSSADVPRTMAVAPASCLLSTPSPSMSDITQSVLTSENYTSTSSIPLLRYSDDVFRNGQPSPMDMWQRDDAAPFNGYDMDLTGWGGRPDLHIEANIESPQSYITRLGDFSEPHQDYMAATMPNQQVYDPALLSATNSHFTWSPVTDSAMTSPCYSNGYSNLSSLSSTDMRRSDTNTSFTSGFLTDQMGMVRLDSSTSQYAKQSPAPVPIQGYNDLSHEQLQYSQSCESLTFSLNGIPSYHDFPAPLMSHEQSSSISLNSSRNKPSRAARRTSETIQASRTRCIAPAGAVDPVPLPPSILGKRPKHVKAEAKNEYSAVKMERVTSQTGEERLCAVIPRNSGPASSKKHQSIKLYCQQCKDQPDGFRGDHELLRHISRAHPQNGTRKVWVCVDSSPDKKFLLNCKACRTKKTYGAYYNCAAHLRRTHFNPRKRGRKCKDDKEKRGGKGGGNWPQMDHLKQNWMQEVEEVVTDITQPFENDADVDANADMDIEIDEDAKYDEGDGGDYMDSSSSDGINSNDVLPPNGYDPDHIASNNLDMTPAVDVAHYPNVVGYATGINTCYGDAYYNGSNTIYQLQQPYEAVGEQMWAAQS